MIPQRELNPWLLDRVPIRAWDRVLFVACADGWLAEEAWRRIGKGYVCGIDLSFELISHARQLRSVPGKLEFERWNGRRVPCPDRSFDHVVSTFALEQCDGPAVLASELERVVRPSGYVYVVEVERYASVVARDLEMVGVAAGKEVLCDTPPGLGGMCLLVLHAPVPTARGALASRI